MNWPAFSSLRKSTRNLIIVLSTLLLVIISGSVLVNSQARKSAMNEPAERENLKRTLLEIGTNDHVYGDKDAKIKMVMYSDTDCQYCRGLYPKLKSLVNEYPNDVALIYRHIPIYYYRGSIDDGERVGECVDEQLSDAGFFDYLDNLFTVLPFGVETSDVSLETLLTSAGAVGAEEEVIENCISQPAIDQTISNMHNSGGALSVTVVPHTFMVSEDEIYSIARNQYRETFQIIIDEILQ